MKRYLNHPLKDTNLSARITRFIPSNPPFIVKFIDDHVYREMKDIYKEKELVHFSYQRAFIAGNQSMFDADVSILELKKVLLSLIEHAENKKIIIIFDREMSRRQFSIHERELLALGYNQVSYDELSKTVQLAINSFVIQIESIIVLN